jgi:hypothetical protein
MALKKVSVKLKGTSALLMHAYPLIPLEAAEKKTAAEQAENAAYRDPDSKELYIPGVNIQRSLVAAAAFSKGKGRSTLQKQVAACVMVEQDRVGLGMKDYKIDSRRVVIAATKGAVVRHRPRIDDWTVSFTVSYDDTLINEKELRQVMDNMGARVGLLDFRPEKKGPFGRSMVIEWKAE